MRYRSIPGIRPLKSAINNRNLVNPPSYEGPIHRLMRKNNEIPLNKRK